MQLIATHGLTLRLVGDGRNDGKLLERLKDSLTGAVLSEGCGLLRGSFLLRRMLPHWTVSYFVLPYHSANMLNRGGQRLKENVEIDPSTFV